MRITNPIAGRVKSDRMIALDADISDFVVNQIANFKAVLPERDGRTADIVAYIVSPYVFDCNVVGGARVPVSTEGRLSGRPVAPTLHGDRFAGIADCEIAEDDSIAAIACRA